MFNPYMQELKEPLISIDELNKLESNFLYSYNADIAEGKDKAVLIDFLDEFDPWALRRSKQRVAQYRKHKWNITQRTLPA